LTRIQVGEPSTPKLPHKRRNTLRIQIFNKGSSLAEEENVRREPYFLRLLNSNNQELAQLKCMQLAPLKGVVNDLKDAKQ